MQLNTQQIVLLCLLVSFVTSIATGITTVSLLEQAPDPVTQTINRVVERTIERVVEPEKDEDNARTVVETPERIIETVIVNQEDLTVEAVAKNSKSLVQIFEKTNPEPVFKIIGIAVTENTVLVDSNLISSGGKYFLRNKNGDFDLSVIKESETDKFILLKLDDLSQTLSPAEFADSNSLQLGQSVISLGGKIADTVSTGIISKLNTEEVSDAEGNSWTQVNDIAAGVGSSADQTGSVLINLKGSLVGFKSFAESLVNGSFTTSNSIKSYLNSQGI
jgi:S1-C subfamily serine protease